MLPPLSADCVTVQTDLPSISRGRRLLDIGFDSVEGLRQNVRNAAIPVCRAAKLPAGPGPHGIKQQERRNFVRNIRPQSVADQINDVIRRGQFSGAADDMATTEKYGIGNRNRRRDLTQNNDTDPVILTLTNRTPFGAEASSNVANTFMAANLMEK